jgi:KTSC domain
VHEVRYVREHDGVFVMPVVSSSAIQQVEYDNRTQQMQITFVSGKTYTYFGVPRSVYERFVQAPSKGTYFNEYIKDQYGFA